MAWFANVPLLVLLTPLLVLVLFELLPLPGIDELLFDICKRLLLLLLLFEADVKLSNGCLKLELEVEGFIRDCCCCCWLADEFFKCLS